MPNRSLIATSAALLMAAGVSMAQAPQTPAPARPAAAPAYRAPRTADGKPNLNGIWQAMNTANWDLEAHSAAPSPIKEFGTTGAIPGGSGVVDGGTIPYLPDALKKKKENQANRLKLDPEVKCYLPGVPRAVYMPYPFQILQSTKHIMMLHEYAGAVRTVYMTDQTEAPADSWMGWSNGKWEGETLVVDTKGFNDLSWFDRSGNFHSDALHVVERFTPRSADTLNYEATIEDSKTFSRPWKISMPLYRHVEPNAQIMEFRCVEFVEDLLYGHLRKQPTSK
ncbi:MAG TPA: hypothetical protein VKB50_18885 [Vicinamibacterales bacterium]|nr:hypothetical protein [Vicinamibacterales bacterium]